VTVGIMVCHEGAKKDEVLLAAMLHER